MTATFGPMTGYHRTSRSATELCIRALSHPDFIPGTFEAVGLRQPVLVVFWGVLPPEAEIFRLFALVLAFLQPKTGISKYF